MEADKRICKICKQLKNRILVGKFDDKNKKYNDETGKSWNGSTCPPCHKEQVRIKMKLTRSLK
jgi:ribonuclease HIII